MEIIDGKKEKITPITTVSSIKKELIKFIKEIEDRAVKESLPITEESSDVQLVPLDEEEVRNVIYNGSYDPDRLAKAICNKFGRVKE